MQESNGKSEKEGIGRKASGNSRKKGEKREKKREVSLEYLRWKVIEARQKIDGRNDGVFETKYSDCHKMI